MKNLLAVVCLGFALPVFAGAMRQIPVQLLPIDNQGRSEFIKNALSATGLLNDETVRYQDLHTIVVGGDEAGSDFKGAFFIFSVKLDSRANGYQEFDCSQFLSVGNFDPRHTRPIECSKL